MIRKKSQAILVESASLVSPSSPLLEHHLSDILEAVEEIHTIAAALKLVAHDEKRRDVYEGRLYAALTHLDHHVKPAIAEWDRVVDRMPDD